MDPVDAIFERHGIHGAWTELRAPGIANRIYATDDIVLRISVATDEGLSDARTESIAAPAAHAAGIATPRMLAWDDSFFERPYSLWERVHGVTVESAFPLGLHELQGRGWSLGSEFREQLAYFDGHLQRGWMLLAAIHLNQW